jgi:flagellar hook-basal body complex protein FliE
MEQLKNQLIKLRGVGKVLATRLVESGLDTYEKIAAAGEAELKKIKGINPNNVAGIIRQAAELTPEKQSKKDKKEEQLKELAASLKNQVKSISTDIHDRFKEDLAGKVGKKVEKEIQKIMVSLEKAETRLRTRSKKVAKGLVQAEKRLAGVQEAGLKKVRKALQGARQSLKKVTSKS